MPFEEPLEGIAGIFNRVARMREDEAFAHVVGFLKDNGYKVVVDEQFYVFAEGTIPIVLNAHVDTVFKQPPVNLHVTTKTGLVFSADDRNGIGADDRSGVAVIIDLINKGYRPHVIVTRLEEHGDEGARHLVEKFKQDPLETRYIIGLDRKGSNDAVYYYLTNKDFKDYIANNFNFKEEHGTVADISVLSRAWNVAGVNISTGYYNPHSEEEIQSLPVLVSVSDRVAAMLENVPPEGFGYVGKAEEAAYLKQMERERARDEEYRAREEEYRKRSAKRAEREAAEHKVIADFRSNPATKQMYDDAMANFAPMATRKAVFEREGMKNKKPSRAALENRGYSDKRIRRFADLVDRITWNVPYCVFNFAKMVFYNVNKEGQVVEHRLSFEEMDKLGIFTMLKIEGWNVLEDDVKELEALVSAPPEKEGAGARLPASPGKESIIAKACATVKGDGGDERERERFRAMLEKDYENAVTAYDQIVSEFSIASTKEINDIFDAAGVGNARYSEYELVSFGFTVEEVKRYKKLTDTVARSLASFAFDFTRNVFYYVDANDEVRSDRFSYDVFATKGILLMLRFDGIFIEHVVVELEKMYKKARSGEKSVKEAAELKEKEREAKKREMALVPEETGYKDVFISRRAMANRGFTKAEIERFDGCSRELTTGIPLFWFNFDTMRFSYKVKGGTVEEELNVFNVSRSGVMKYFEKSTGNPYGFAHLEACIRELMDITRAHQPGTKGKEKETKYAFDPKKGPPFGHVFPDAYFLYGKKLSNDEIVLFKDCATMLARNLDWISFDFVKMSYSFRFGGGSITSQLNVANLKRDKVFEYVRKAGGEKLANDLEACAYNVIELTRKMNG